jgi:hypothetical protein
MLTLCCKFQTVKLHMCRYNLHLPSSERLLRKSTRLLVLHAQVLRIPTIDVMTGLAVVLLQVLPK